jgi:hypothetical protein
MGLWYVGILTIVPMEGCECVWTQTKESRAKFGAHQESISRLVVDI